MIVKFRRNTEAPPGTASAVVARPSKAPRSTTRLAMRAEPRDDDLSHRSCALSCRAALRVPGRPGGPPARRLVPRLDAPPHDARRRWAVLVSRDH